MEKMGSQEKGRKVPWYVHTCTDQQGAAFVVFLKSFWGRFARDPVTQNWEPDVRITFTKQSIQLNRSRRSWTQFDFSSTFKWFLKILRASSRIKCKISHSHTHLLSWESERGSSSRTSGSGSRHEAGLDEPQFSYNMIELDLGELCRVRVVACRFFHRYSAAGEKF